MSTDNLRHGLRFSPALLVPVGLFLLALAARLYCLDCRSLWGDEVASIETAQRGVTAILTDQFGWLGYQPPLHYLIVWLTTLPVDPTTTSALVRLPSAVIGALTVPLLYALGHVLFGRAQGILAALLLALAPIHLNYSQDARPYVMLMFLTVLSVYCLVMAVRTGSSWWWLSWATSTTVNLLNSYFALMLAIPALVPYATWVLWRLLTGPRKSARSLIAASVSMAAVALVVLLVLADVLKAPRIGLDLSRLTLAGLFYSPVDLATWFTQFGLGGQVERIAQMVLLIVALLGIYYAVRARRWEGLFLCACFILIPSVLLAVLGTANAVFQRYALFTMPFYYMLVASGLVYLAALLLRAVGALPGSRRAWVAAVVYVPAILLFMFGTGVYFRTDLPNAMTYRPDFRSASQYLSEHARPEDTILFLGWNATVSNFYWKWQPPAHSYYAIDPRLNAGSGTGSVYWVFSYEGERPPEVVDDPGWAEVVQLNHVQILKEQGQGGDMQSSLLRMADLLEADPRYARLAVLLRGCVYQANNEIARAAEAYRSAGTYFPIAVVYLPTAIGFAKRGETGKAWQEATTSKYWEPDNPDVHDWLARQLADEEYPAESQAESEIATALRDGP